ncbi:MAG: hypothetical protein U0Y68_15735 [Blastocatellia bacterium]
MNRTSLKQIGLPFCLGALWLTSVVAQTPTNHSTGRMKGNTSIANNTATKSTDRARPATDASQKALETKTRASRRAEPTRKAAEPTTRTAAQKSKASELAKSNRSSKAIGGETAATKRGKAEHKQFQEKYGNKKGRLNELSMTDIKTRKGIRPDIVTPRNRPVELKPDTPSGRKAMEKQITQYENTTGRRGIRVYYGENGTRRAERTPYRDWKAREYRPMP